MASGSEGGNFVGGISGNLDILSRSQLKIEKQRVMPPVSYLIPHRVKFLLIKKCKQIKNHKLRMFLSVCHVALFTPYALLQFPADVFCMSILAHCMHIHIQ